MTVVGDERSTQLERDGGRAEGARHDERKGAAGVMGQVFRTLGHDANVREVPGRAGQPGGLALLGLNQMDRSIRKYRGEGKAGETDTAAHVGDRPVAPVDRRQCGGEQRVDEMALESLHGVRDAREILLLGSRGTQDVEKTTARLRVNGNCGGGEPLAQAGG